MALTPIIIEKWPEKPIILRQENDVNSRIFQIDLTDYIEEFGAGGTFGIRIQRLADGNIWTGEVEADGGIVTWTVPAAAVAKGGRGFIQFVYSIEGTLVANTPLIPTITPASIPTDENPPDPWLPWTEQIESEIAALERNKQDVLTFDETPTADSQNPVTSGGVKAALDNKADKVMDATPGELAALDAAGNLRNSDLLASDVSAHIADRNNPHEVTKAQIGLGNVDNTSDANKPISTAQQTALNGKADKVAGAVANDLAALDASGNLKDAGKKLADLQDKLTFDQTPTNGSANPVTSGGVYEALTHKAEKSVVEAIEELIPSQASSQNKLADKEFVNSSIATNTADYISNNGEPFTSVAQLEAYSGPVTNNDYAFVTGVDAEGNTYYDRYKATVSGSTVTWAKEYRLNNSSFTTEQWAAIQSGITDTLVAAYNAHLLDRNNPHEVTKAQVGLGNVDNTSDANKPVSTAQQTALDGKADKVTGAVANDLAALDASGNLLDSGKKLADLQDKLTFDTEPTAGSTNPVTSGGVKTALDGKADKVTGAVAGDLASLDASGNLTDSGKKLADLQDKLTFDAAPTAGSTNPVTSGGVKTALDGKADKVAGAVADDLAALDATGNLTDSGKKLADLQLAAFGNAANDPEQSSFNVLMNPAAKGPIISSIIKGKTVAVNQLVQNGNFADGTTGWIAESGNFTVSSGIAQFVATEQNGALESNNDTPVVAGHKYLLRAKIKLTTATDKVRLYSWGQETSIYSTTTTDWQTLEQIITAVSSTTTQRAIYIIDTRTSGWDAIQVDYCDCVDVTTTFSTAIVTEIGTDVAKLKSAWLKDRGFPLPQYIPNDAGSLANVNGVYRMRGRNLFDKSTFVDNKYVKADGTEEAYAQTFCTDYIPILPNTAYYSNANTQGSLTTHVFFDANQNVVGTSTASNAVFTSPANARFVRANCRKSAISVDALIINLSDASFNGTNEKYYNGGVIDCSSAPLNGTSTTYDEKDFATGKRATRFVRKVLDGSENWTWYNPSNSVLLNDALDGRKGLGSTAYLYGVCNRVASQTDDVIDYTVIRASASNTTQLQIVQIGQNFGITDLSVDGWKAWLASNNLEFIYELATPVVTTETPQPLHTQDGYNVLEPVSGGVQSAEVETTYVKDENTGKMLEWIEAQTA